jgi:hypothetical protein
VGKHERRRSVVKLYEIHVAIEILDLLQDKRLFAEVAMTVALARRSQQPAMLSCYPKVRNFHIDLGLLTALCLKE